LFSVVFALQHANNPPASPMRRIALAILLATTVVTAGCHQHHVPSAPAFDPVQAGLTPPDYVDQLDATVVPPAGWKPDPVKSSSQHIHQVWLSPSGRTAYGVIHFMLPLPVGHDLALWGFIREMRRSEGDAQLLAKRWDPNYRLMRFVAQGGKYVVRANLLIRGSQGWAVYAGTLKNDRVEPDELELAEVAREHTRIGRRVIGRDAAHQSVVGATAAAGNGSGKLSEQ
jgi:hypothetical protein